MKNITRCHKSDRDGLMAGLFHDMNRKLEDTESKEEAWSGLRKELQITLWDNVRSEMVGDM